MAIDLEEAKTQLIKEIMEQSRVNQIRPWDVVNHTIMVFVNRHTQNYFEIVKIKPIFTHSIRFLFDLKSVERMDKKHLKHANDFTQELIALLEKYKNIVPTEPPQP